MDNLDKQLSDFAQKCEDIKTKEFENFPSMEKAYCDLINEGGKIRSFIINNPDICDENSYLVLTNKSQDFSLLDEKYRCLSQIIFLSKTLFEKYSVYVKELVASQRYEEAISIYAQMFNFSRNYWYKKEIANILYKMFGQLEAAHKIYKEIKPYFENDSTYLYGYSEILYNMKRYYEATLCIQKAMLIDKAEMEGSGV